MLTSEQVEAIRDARAADPDIHELTVTIDELRGLIKRATKMMESCRPEPGAQPLADMYKALE